jgi:hypothetical protein
VRQWLGLADGDASIAVLRFFAGAAALAGVVYAVLGAAVVLSGDISGKLVALALLFGPGAGSFLLSAALFAFANIATWTRQLARDRGFEAERA